MLEHFDFVQIIAVHEKLFPGLEQDCWLLYADGCGGRTANIAFTVMDRFAAMPTPPRPTLSIPATDWKATWGGRLRPFLLPSAVRALYQDLAWASGSRRFSDIASVRNGYVTGANGFFHRAPAD